VCGDFLHFDWSSLAPANVAFHTEICGEAMMEFIRLRFFMHGARSILASREAGEEQL
jgi:hypothetical protein